MNYEIPFKQFPEEVEKSTQLTPEERDKPKDPDADYDRKAASEGGGSFHEKLAKNNREKVERKSYQTILKERYKKPLRRGDKILNMKKKNKKR